MSKLSPKDDENRLIAAAMKRLSLLEKQTSFYPGDPKSKPTPAQEEMLKDLGVVPVRWAVCANRSGKTLAGCRETSWVFEENHPWWKRPARWRDNPIQIIIAGRTRDQVVDIIWSTMKLFLDPASYKEHWSSSSLHKVTHKNGNVITFVSHHSIDEAREKVQGYEAHYVWVDEMPKNDEFIEELMTRTNTTGGYFLGTFTPKNKNERIRQMVDSAALPYSKRYTFKMFDNPSLTTEDKAKIMFDLSTKTESYRRTVLFGDWSAGDQSAFDFDMAKHCMAPIDYSPTWRHIVAIDPAMSGKSGYVALAECPLHHKWYVVKAEYIQGIFAPSDLVRIVEKMNSEYNVVRRVYDPHETWFMRQASKDTDKSWIGVYKKTERKNELIKKLQEALTSGIMVVSPWCKEAIAELNDAEVDDSDRIIKSTRYHILDALQYAIDNLPKKSEVSPFAMTHDQLLFKKHFEREKREKARMSKGRIQRRSNGGGAWRPW